MHFSSKKSIMIIGTRPRGVYNKCRNTSGQLSRWLAGGRLCTRSHFCQDHYDLSATHLILTSYSTRKYAQYSHDCTALHFSVKICHHQKLGVTRFSLVALLEHQAYRIEAQSFVVTTIMSASRIFNWRSFYIYPEILYCSNRFLTSTKQK